MTQSYNTMTFSQIVVGSAQYLLVHKCGINEWCKETRLPQTTLQTVSSYKTETGRLYVTPRFKINTNMTIKPLRGHFEQPLHCLKAEIGKFHILKTSCVFGHVLSLKNVNFFAALVKKKSLQNELFCIKGLLFTMPVQYLEGEGTNQQTRVENTYLINCCKEIYRDHFNI